MSKIKTIFVTVVLGGLFGTMGFTGLVYLQHSVVNTVQAIQLLTLAVDGIYPWMHSH